MKGLLVEGLKLFSRIFVESLVEPERAETAVESLTGARTPAMGRGGARAAVPSSASTAPDASANMLHELEQPILVLNVPELR